MRITLTVPTYLVPKGSGKVLKRITEIVCFLWICYYKDTETIT